MQITERESASHYLRVSEAATIMGESVEFVHDGMGREVGVEVSTPDGVAIAWLDQDAFARMARIIGQGMDGDR